MNVISSYSYKLQTGQFFDFRTLTLARVKKKSSFCCCYFLSVAEDILDNFFPRKSHYLPPSSYITTLELQGLPRWLSGKESTCQCRRRGFGPWVRKIPCSRKWQPTPVFLSGKFHGQRCLADCSPRGCKESDTTLQLSTHTHTAITKVFPSLQLSLLRVIKV